MHIDVNNLPRRIILSRKGFDSTRKGGGFSSPIINGRLVSIPITQHGERNANAENPPRYSHLPVADCTEGISNFGQIFGQLGRHSPDPEDVVHLDPDIRPSIRNNRSYDEQGYFGQDSGSLTELRNHGVLDLNNKPLFLFFGLFQAIKSYRNRWILRGPKKHIIWGWMQVDQIFESQQLDEIERNSDEIDPDFSGIRYHPHVTYRDHYGENNAIFAAKKEAFGKFDRLHPSLQLTSSCSDCPNLSCDLWGLPPDIFGAAMNRRRQHAPCEHGTVVANYTGQGQEFIFDTSLARNAFGNWLSEISQQS